MQSWCKRPILLRSLSLASIYQYNKQTKLSATSVHCNVYLSAFRMHTVAVKTQLQNKVPAKEMRFQFYLYALRLCYQPISIHDRGNNKPIPSVCPHAEVRSNQDFAQCFDDVSMFSVLDMLQATKSWTESSIDSVAVSTTLSNDLMLDRRSSMLTWTASAKLWLPLS